MFTDQGLGDQMAATLVNEEVMTGQELENLCKDSTENNVRDTLTVVQLNNFNAYWAVIGNWINNVVQGGDFATMSGTNVQGRQGGNPQGIAARALHNDAFRDVRLYIGQQGFSAVKAISNHLRFIKNIVPED